MRGGRARLWTLAMAGVGAALAAGWSVRPTESEVSDSAPSTTELDIALYTRRTQEDPWSAADYATLASLRLQHGREGGGLDDFRRAETAARSSLALRTDRNDRTRLLLASSLLAQHRFGEAREEARAAVAADTADVGARSLLAEIELELGDYAEADRQFTELLPASTHLAVAPRLARWHEVHGRLDEAYALLVDTRDAAARRADLPAEQMAWFHLRVGDFLLRHGDLTAARDALEAGLEIRPDDPRLLGALARVEMLEGRLRRATALVERAGDGADLATLSLGGDAWTARGEPARAEIYYAEIERRAVAQAEPFNRQWTEFRVTHGRLLDETIAILQEELKERPDALGHDLLARALCAAGRMEEAARIRIPPRGEVPQCAAEAGALNQLSYAL